jgi:hypothetical protein
MRSLFIVVAGVLLTSTPVFADIYKCQIVSVLTVDTDGSAKPFDYFQKMASEQELVIDRDSGRVYHNIFGNENGINTILSQGSESTIFKLLSKGGNDVNYYEVSEFGFTSERNKSGNFARPLRIITLGKLATGICHSFPY